MARLLTNKYHETWLSMLDIKLEDALQQIN